MARVAVVSCGIVLHNDRDELFACHATGTGRWDLPKGLVDPGEAPRETVAREAWEEAGLRLPADALADLGDFAYLPSKRLHLFALHVADDAIALAHCRCRSFFQHPRTPRPMPETDAWAWQPRGRLDWCGKNMARVLAGLDWSAIAALPRVGRIEVDRG